MNNVFKALTIWALTPFLSVSLIAQPATVLKPETKKQEQVSQKQKTEETSQTALTKKKSEKALKEIDDAQELEVIMENSDELDPSFDDSDLEDRSHTAAETDSDVLYDPNMNYGHGAPAPHVVPFTTKYRSLLAFVASVALATAGMLVSAKNGGRSPAPGASKCPS